MSARSPADAPQDGSGGLPQRPAGAAWLSDVLRVNAEYVVDMQFTPTWNQWTGALGTRIAEAVSGQKSPEAALAQAEDEVNRFLAQEK